MKNETHQMREDKQMEKLEALVAELQARLAAKDEQIVTLITAKFSYLALAEQAEDRVEKLQAALWTIPSYVQDEVERILYGKKGT